MIKNWSLEKKVSIGISVSLLIISLTQPAFYTADDPNSLNLGSVGLLFMGWIGIFAGAPDTLFWFANPLYFFALYRFAIDKRNSIVPSLIASIIAICFSFLDTFIKNENGARTTITGLGSGYFLWAAGISVLTLGIILSKRTKKRLG